LHGLNFEGDPGRYATGRARFLDAEEKAYKRHLAHLAMDVDTASAGSAMDRLSRIYDCILIDEVQDLNGYDLEVLDALINAQIELRLVGDVRQATLFTNPQDPKNKQYKGIKIKTWFEDQEKAGRLSIDHQNQTWRSNQAIADFADSVFDPSWGFAKTKSANTAVTGHDGVFQLAQVDVMAYVEQFDPLCLRSSAATAKEIDLPFSTFGSAKGMEAERVLIWPTGPIMDFIKRGKELKPLSSCALYVAITRARSSVAVVVPKPVECDLPLWSPD